MPALPLDFTGVRSVSEARQDLAAIAASGPGSEAHVSLEPGRGEGLSITGRLAVTVSGASVSVEVDGADVAVIDTSQIRGAWLRTLDGDQYYSLKIDLRSAVLYVSDAYNGL